MRKMVAGILSCALMLSLAVVPEADVKAAGVETIASLDYSYSGSGDVEYENGKATTDLNKTKYGSKKNGYVFTKGNARLYASVCGTKKRKLEWSAENDVVTSVYKMNDSKTAQPVMTAGKKDATVQWTKGTTPYFEVELSTKGYKDVTFSAYVGATKKGPRDYALSYAVGSSNSFTKLSDSTAKLSLADNKKMYKISGKLPSTANDNSTVKVRIEITSMRIVDASQSGVYLYTNPSSGEAAINHILIQGTKTATTSGSTVTTSSSTKKTTGKVKKVTLNRKKLSLKKGKTYKLKATVKATTKAAQTAAKKKLKWSSSNKKVVTVTKSGKIKAKKKGTAKITVKYSSKIKATCKVTVK
ncbi:MAG: Ig-like domain-containing protein [Eubacterium sp.]|nr:Ig-like domain-containing protein [Eubacterium sp.]